MSDEQKNDALAIVEAPKPEVKAAPLIPYSDIERMAQAFAASGLFGVKTREQAIALMLLAQAEGLHPATAARDYHIINGQPALKADAMLARFQNTGGRHKWLEYTDTRVVGWFAHPQGGEVTIDWDMERAKQAGLGGKDNWRKFPRQMLKARVVSEGVRAVSPGILQGLYTPEEVVDFDDMPVAPSSAPPRQEYQPSGAAAAPETAKVYPKTPIGKWTPVYIVETREGVAKSNGNRYLNLTAQVDDADWRILVFQNKIDAYKAAVPNFPYMGALEMQLELTQKGDAYIANAFRAASEFTEVEEPELGAPIEGGAPWEASAGIVNFDAGLSPGD